MNALASLARARRVVAVLAIAGGCAAISEAALPSRSFGEFLGEIHSGGKYSLPTRSPANDYLNEGADRIADLGSRTIKVWLTPSPTAAYPDFSGSHPWPTTPANLKELLQTAAFQELLNRAEFTTYIFVASEFVPKQSGSGYTTTTWKDGLSAAEQTAVTAQFQDVAAWLLTTYAGTGKTFIFQNWEGDNSLNLDLLNATEQQTAIAGMIAWLNARQTGVSQARAASSATGVAVYNAAEINYNPGTNSSFPVSDALCMVNAVVPSLTCDLYSWSNWASKTPGNEINVIRGLDYLKKKAPSSAAFGHDNVYMGEFGAYESSYMGASAPWHSAESDAAYSALIDQQLAYAWRWGARFAVQWAGYDNGLRTGVTFDPSSPSLLTEDKFVGTWLIRARANAADALSYSFTSAYGRLARLNGRVLHDDPLANLTLATSTSGSWSVTTSNQVWDEDDLNRVYRTTTGSTASLTYATTAPIVDWDIRAFIMDATTASGRIRGYTSTDGVTWSAPFEFGEVDNFVPDSAGAPNCRRLHLGPPTSGIPAGTRYLRIELFGATAATATQLGHLRLVTEEIATFDDPVNSLTLTEAGLNSANLSVSNTVASYSEDDAGRVYRNSTAPGWIVYHTRHPQDLRFKVYHYGTTLAGKVAARVSYDGQIWTVLTLNFDPSTPTASGWYRTWVHAASALPEGTRYVMIELNDPTNSWAQQIGQVKFDRIN